MGDWKEALKINLRRNKLTAMFLASIFLFSLAYIGIGYTVASQGISANPGCGMWASNTPDNWTTDDDWQSFEPWNDSEERIDIRKISMYQIINISMRMQHLNLGANQESPYVVGI